MIQEALSKSTENDEWARKLENQTTICKVCLYLVTKTPKTYYISNRNTIQTTKTNKIIFKDNNYYERQKNLTKNTKTAMTNRPTDKMVKRTSNCIKIVILT